MAPRSVNPFALGLSGEQWATLPGRVLVLTLESIGPGAGDDHTVLMVIDDALGSVNWAFMVGVADGANEVYAPAPIPMIPPRARAEYRGPIPAKEFRRVHNTAASVALRRLGRR